VACCSKCQEPAEHSILVRQEPVQFGVRVVAFCKNHWAEVVALLP
jgi:hypothetical protein